MDAIDRQAAIDYIKSQRGRLFKGFTIEEAVLTLIREVPSVQPEFTDSEIQKIQELEQAQIKKAYELGFEEGKESARREAREDGRDRLD